jgi:hypothetical protein
MSARRMRAAWQRQAASGPAGDSIRRRAAGPAATRPAVRPDRGPARIRRPARWQAQARCDPGPPGHRPAWETRAHRARRAADRPPSGATPATATATMASPPWGPRPGPKAESPVRPADAATFRGIATPVPGCPPTPPARPRPPAYPAPAPPARCPSPMTRPAARAVAKAGQAPRGRLQPTWATGRWVSCAVRSGRGVRWQNPPSRWLSQCASRNARRKAGSKGQRRPYRRASRRSCGGMTRTRDGATADLAA